MIYPPNYIPYHFNEHLGSFIAGLRNFVQKQKIKPIAAYARPGSVIVDIGCGSGEFLRILKKYGDRSWKLIGVDFAEEAINNLERFGIAGRQGRFESMQWKGAAPSIITMQQVIEHLEDPAAVVEKAYTLLPPAGILMLETPSVDGWDARLFQKRYWGGWHTPRHWNLYDERTLGRLMKDKGFEIVETTYLLSPNFWLQSLHHWFAERHPRLRVARYFDVSCLPALAVATSVDVFQLLVHNRTSNFRIVGRKPQPS